MRQCMYYKAHEIAEESPEETTQNYSGQMEQRWQIPQIFLWCRVDRGKSHSIRRNRIWRPLFTLRQDKKEVGTRSQGNFHWMQRVYKDHWISAVTWDSRSRHAKNCTKSIQQSLEVETNLSLQSKTSPTKAPSTVCRPWGIRLSTRSFYRMAILSFFHNAFIFVITMATKQRLVVNVELGLVEIFILDWTVYFFKNCSSDVISLARNLISWQSTVSVKRTPAAHTFFSCVFCQRVCPSFLSHLSR